MRQFGQDLITAIEHLVVYQKTHEIAELSAAWKIFTSVFQKLKVVMSDIKILPLSYVSPALAAVRDSQICMPATYLANTEMVRIDSIVDNIMVIESTHRVKKIDMIGTDGKTYSYLLKAREYTKMEERIMQLCAFLNSLLETSDLPLKDKLSITTYKVVPLAPQIALISWVKNCSPVFNIITEMRRLAKKDAMVEERYAMSATGNKYYTLPLEEKLPVFEKALSTSEANEIQKTLLNYSADSAHWLQRRTNFTTSLAATSIFGYVIGLGERHPHNILLNTSTAKLIHIDYGRCFDRALSRTKWTEKVPFRLTRMFLNALEVSKIEGTFRTCCENIMKLIRHNGNEFMEVLEVCMYDCLQGSAEGESSVETTFSKVKAKVSGRNQANVKVSVTEQVDKLITEATSHSNLADMFAGWMPWW